MTNADATEIGSNDDALPVEGIGGGGTHWAPWPRETVGSGRLEESASRIYPELSAPARAHRLHRTAKVHLGVQQSVPVAAVTSLSRSAM